MIPIYIQLRVEEPSLMEKFGLPEQNAIGLQLLNELIRADLLQAGLSFEGLCCGGSINDGCLLLLTQEPFKALRVIRATLEKVALAHFATIHWFDAAEGIERPFQRGMYDTKANFDAEQFEADIKSKLETHILRRKAAIAALPPLLQPPPLPPQTPPAE